MDTRTDMEEAARNLVAQVATLKAENERLRERLVDAGALHLADEQSVRNCERVIAELRAEVAHALDDGQRVHEVRNTLRAERDALRLDLARVTAERDALLAAAKAAYTVQPGWLDILRLAVAEVEKPDAVPAATPTEETKPEPGRKR